MHITVGVHGKPGELKHQFSAESTGTDVIRECGFTRAAAPRAQNERSE